MACYVRIKLLERVVRVVVRVMGPGNTSATDNRLITATRAELGRWTDKSDCLTWTGSLSTLPVSLSTDSFRPDRPNYASAIYSVNLKLRFTAKFKL